MLFIEKSLLKPLRPQIILQILQSSFFNLYYNAGDQLIKLFTSQVLTYSDAPVVTFTFIQLELVNALNKSISSNLSAAFRINMQLKRYDRVFSFFLSSFWLLLVNLAYQLITFSVRNQLYKLVYNGDFDSTFELYHGSVDGLLGTFAAYSTAVIFSDLNKLIKFIIGSFKLILSVGFWFTAKYTNTGNSHYSSMLYLYKYCTDIIGFGFYVLFFQKFYRLKKMNQCEQEIKEPKLILQELQTIESVSRNASEDSKSKEVKDLSASKTKEIISQSWALDEVKGSKEE
ncbi:MatE_and transmembrane domain-containing protein [Hexamita inflata]|uniref:MatE_and transmembrane domain-containing protein n=1 Tax=Hexamita inflata TaxID=28002 RepID=A0ABP1ISS0_9EUKA